MPNHIAHILTVTNPRMVELVKRDVRTRDFALDFDRIIPTPPLLDVDVRVADITPTYDPHGLSERRARCPEQMFNFKNFGAYHILDWRRCMWGVSVNAYEAFWSENSLMFQTAWETPHRIFLVLAARFPNAYFELKWASEDLGQYLGRADLNAERSLLTTEEKQFGSPAAVRFATEVWDAVNPSRFNNDAFE